MKILLIAGARPNFVKVAALWRAYLAFKKRHPKSNLSMRLINTGQHYDYLMAKKLFEDLGLPKPVADLNVGSSSHATQTAKIMIRFEQVALREKPNLVMVVGDVNSTMACSLVASKMNIPVAHVESGLRSFDRTMPEEINRLVTDGISDYLFTSCRDADKNLQREGVSKAKIFFVGNVMVDTLFTHLKRARQVSFKTKIGLSKSPYAILTLHRPSNVDRESDFLEIINALEKISQKIKIIFPIHPRTEKRLKAGKLKARIKNLPNLILIPPTGYLDFISLLDGASLVLTDSGGVQEETTALGIPCVTLRDNTERPVTITEGTNCLAGRKSKRIIQAAELFLKQGRKRKRTLPVLWDGKTAERIFSILSKKFGF